MSGTQNDRFDKLLQAAKEKLSAEETEMLAEEKGLLIESKLLLPGAIELSTVEQLRGCGMPLGTALLLKKAFPSKSLPSNS
jgi:hypothetical protein